MNWMKEDGYEAAMEETVVPYLVARRETGFFERVPGEEIYYEHYSNENRIGTLVLLHGFSEGIGKFREVIYYFLQGGMEVWAMQQREHGKSFRSTDDPYLVHLTDYQDLIEDLHYYVENIVKQHPDTLPDKMALYAHSMGGGVSACYLERYPDDFARAVLSSPMLEMKAGDAPLWAAVLYVRLMLLLGKGKNYMPGTMPFSGEPDFANGLDDSLARYQYWFRETKEHVENQMSVASLSTAMQFYKLTREATAPENCAKIKADVLLFQAGKDTIVRLEGQNRFKKYTPHCRLVPFPDSKHELYM